MSNADTKIKRKPNKADYDENERFENTEQKPDVIAGRNPVSEAVRSNRPIDKILVAKGEKSGAIVGILAKPVIRKFPLRKLTAQSLIM